MLILRQRITPHLAVAQQQGHSFGNDLLRLLAKGKCVKGRNSLFGVFFGHGSKGEHEAPVGTEQDTVCYGGHGAAARRSPAKGKRFGKLDQVIPPKSPPILQEARKKSQVSIYNSNKE